MEKISVHLEDDNFVVLSPNENVSELSWRRVVIFWSENIADALSKRIVIVSLNTFVQKLSWLRDVWEKSGGHVELNEDVIKEVHKFRNGSRDFIKLRQEDPQRYSNKSVDVPGLSGNRVLTKEQAENILYLLDMSNGANFSVPGAGKTLVSLCVWRILIQRGKVGKLLVICPRSAFESWKIELSDSFGLHGLAEVFKGDILAESTELCLVNYEQLEKPSVVEYLTNWLQMNSGHLVVDEAHRVKAGPKSIRWQAVYKLALASKRVDILTGTPMPQGPRDLISLFTLAWPQVPRNNLDLGVLPLLTRNTVFVRTTKGELNLPPAEPIKIVNEASPLQQEILDALKDRYVGQFFASIGDSKNLAKRGRAIMTMLAASTNPGLLIKRDFSDVEMGLSWPPMEILRDTTLSSLIENYLNHEIPWKFKFVASRVAQLAAQGEKVLVWSNFVGNVAALKTVLRKFYPAVVYGATASDDRVMEIEKFRNNPACKVLISNPQTLGEGISLHMVCHNEIFVDRTYNAGLYLQAVDRIHRLGLKADQNTSIEILITKSSIDERVSTRLDAKISTLSRFLNDQHLVAAAIPQGDEISPSEVLGLDEVDFADIASFWGLPNVE